MEMEQDVIVVKERKKDWHHSVHIIQAIDQIGHQGQHRDPLLRYDDMMETELCLIVIVECDKR